MRATLRRDHHSLYACTAPALPSRLLRRGRPRWRPYSARIGATSRVAPNLCKSRRGAWVTERLPAPPERTAVLALALPLRTTRARLRPRLPARLVRRDVFFARVCVVWVPHADHRAAAAAATAPSRRGQQAGLLCRRRA